MKARTWTTTAVALFGFAFCASALAQAAPAFFRVVALTDTVITALSPDGTMVWTTAVAGVTGTVQRAVVLGAESNWTDYVRFSQTDTVSTLRVVDPNPPEGMALIPAGSFSMGDSFVEGDSDERPVHTVYVSAFYMDKTEVTKAKWDEVKTWATTNGYAFDNAGLGKATNHPVHTVSWYDVVKWSNARSEKEGLTPCYTVGGAVYKTGLSAPDCNWSAGGYRLPTEAEWEKAARGGASRQRFPWGSTIDHSRANYYGSPSGYTYDAGYQGYDTRYATGGTPHTSPVGSFAANGYGLFDMVGNMSEWCWDWLESYKSGSQSDPRGPATGSDRVYRGGAWCGPAGKCRTALRDIHDPSIRYYFIGFRSVRPPGQ